jgi:alanine racemase
MDMGRPTAALIDPAALAHNVLQVRRLAPHSQVWAVVKANGYGHGLERACRGLGQADGFALVEFDAAQRLRELEPQRALLMLEGAFGADDTEFGLRHDIRLTVHHLQQVHWLERLVTHQTKDLALNIKFNSGMNRLGMDQAATIEAVMRLTRAGFRHLTLMTHFADADLPGGIDIPWQKFNAMHDAVALATGQRWPISCSNSAATIDHPQTHGQWVRPGVMMYGATPFAASRGAGTLGLRAAMGLYSELIAVRDLDPGDAVGYGSTFVAAKAMRIGVVACGYADGYPRHAPTGTPVLVEGLRCSTVGRVAMDMLMVDLSACPQAQPGSAVELWGAALAVDDVAASAGTIGYELMCALAPRVAVVEGALR